MVYLTLTLSIWNKSAVVKLKNDSEISNEDLSERSFDYNPYDEQSNSSSERSYKEKATCFKWG